MRRCPTLARARSRDRSSYLRPIQPKQPSQVVSPSTDRMVLDRSARIAEKGDVIGGRPERSSNASVGRCRKART